MLEYIIRNCYFLEHLIFLTTKKMIDTIIRKITILEMVNEDSECSVTKI